MPEKKRLYRKEDRKEIRTVEAYACSDPCKCSACVNCNPCNSTPSTAYLDRRNGKIWDKEVYPYMHAY